MAATKLLPATNVVLMFLFSQSGYENFVSMDLVTMAEELKMSSRTIARAMNQLVEMKIVIKIKGGYGPDRRRNEYYINPIAAWKGNSYTRLQAIKKADKNQLLLWTGENKENDNEVPTANV